MTGRRIDHNLAADLRVTAYPCQHRDPPVSILSAIVAPSGRWIPAQMPVRMCRLMPRALQLVFQQHEQFLHGPGGPAGL